MADARALLRQHRQARRITHPYAAYSSQGTLLCTLCRETIKTESLWEPHVQSPTHRQRLASSQQQQSNHQQEVEEEPSAANKRKHSASSAEEEEGGEETAQPIHPSDRDQETSRKRLKSRPDISDTDSLADLTRTPPPPSITRRSSTTPSQGVELQIPSRPATPRDSAAAASNNGTTATTTLPSRQASSTLVPGPPLPRTTATKQGAQPQTVDEDEWAAFEADIAATDYAPEATISAPAMSSEQAAAAKLQAQEGNDDDGGGDPRNRTTKREADLKDEREDARRALEEELDEMHTLEAKVLRLKQQRDALKLKQRAASHGAAGKQRPTAGGLDALDTGKENAAAVEEEEESDEEEEDDDDDGWDGFRFHAGVTSRA